MAGKGGNFRITEEIRKLCEYEMLDIQYRIDGKIFRKHLKTEKGLKIGTAIAAMLLSKAFDGEIKAITEIIDRIDGKATQPLALQDTVDIKVGFDDEA